LSALDLLLGSIDEGAIRPTIKVGRSFHGEEPCH